MAGVDRGMIDAGSIERAPPVAVYILTRAIVNASTYSPLRNAKALSRPSVSKPNFS